MNDEDSYGRGGVFHPLASVGSWAECLTSAAHVSAGVTFGLPAHRSLRRSEVYDDALIKGKPYILGLKRRGFTAKNGNMPSYGYNSGITTAELERLHNCFIACDEPNSAGPRRTYLALQRRAHASGLNSAGFYRLRL
jgi:hypothetical protein